MLLAPKFKRPIPIILGISTATLANHALAGLTGAWIAAEAGPVVTGSVIGGAFIVMAGWVIIPDKADDGTTGTLTRFGVFGTTVFALLPGGDRR